MEYRGQITGNDELGIIEVQRTGVIKQTTHSIV
jgi:hypothetical protein